MRASTPWIVVDLPHLWSGWARRTLTAADDVVLVASPDLANLRNAKNLVDALKSARPNDHPPRLVLNGVGMLRRPEIAAAEFAKTVEVKPVAVIPHDAKLFGAAANNGQMIAEIDAKGKIAQTFDELAKLVAGWTAPPRAKKGVLDLFKAALAWAWE
jgi:pilus assembly protein CpaE